MKSIKVVFANTSVWGPIVEAFLLGETADGVDLLGFSEHRAQTQEERFRMTMALRAADRRAFSSVAGLPLGKGHADDELFSGGTVLAPKRALLLGEVESNSETAQHKKLYAHGLDWSACVLKLKGVDLLLVQLYFTNSLGVKGSNVIKLGEIQALILRNWRLPFVLFGDFNMAPETLQASNFLREIRGEIRLPTNLAATCWTGSVIDYLVVAANFSEAVFNIQGLFDSPWKAHALIGFEVLASPRILNCRVLRRPALFQQGGDKRANKPAGPGKKQALEPPVWQNTDLVEPFAGHIGFSEAASLEGTVRLSDPHGSQQAKLLADYPLDLLKTPLASIAASAAAVGTGYLGWSRFWESKLCKKIAAATRGAHPLNWCARPASPSSSPAYFNKSPDDKRGGGIPGASLSSRFLVPRLRRDAVDVGALPGGNGLDNPRPRCHVVDVGGCPGGQDPKNILRVRRAEPPTFVTKPLVPKRDAKQKWGEEAEEQFWLSLQARLVEFSRLKAAKQINAKTAKHLNELVVFLRVHFGSKFRQRVADENASAEKRLAFSLYAARLADVTALAPKILVSMIAAAGAEANKLGHRRRQWVATRVRRWARQATAKSGASRATRLRPRKTKLKPLTRAGPQSKQRALHTLRRHPLFWQTLGRTAAYKPRCGFGTASGARQARRRKQQISLLNCAPLPWPGKLRSKLLGNLLVQQTSGEDSRSLTSTDKLVLTFGRCSSGLRFPMLLWQVWLAF